MSHRPATCQFAFYFVDWDGGSRKQTVQLIDRSSFSDISPVQIVDTFEGGVWMVWQYRFEVLRLILFMFNKLKFNYVVGAELE